MSLKSRKRVNAVMRKQVTRFNAAISQIPADRGIERLCRSTRARIRDNIFRGRDPFEAMTLESELNKLKRQLGML